MAQSLCPPLSESWLLFPGWGPPRPLPLPPSDRDCGCSPASSPDSWGSVPAGSPELSPGRPGTHAAAGARGAGRRGARSSRLGSGQRQSASEREKLRMRTLARALHELRRFLPPSVAPAGQSLTKIETLRLAIRYIGHLSAVLGLSEESLQRRRRRRSDAAVPRGCPLCPDGGPAQTQVQVQVEARAQLLRSAASPSASWGSPPACLGELAAPQPRDPPVLYDEAACSESQAMEPSPSSPLFPGDVLSLLETWMPLSPLEWPPA
ncbi:mesoderm posterior protein 1 [Herpailurus yagouaroundi]|uniref:mesoderm posterior protein 1 n=1 Tax=Herpailurus yagouaroundi TaxID=1608482 RepID=UPI001AD7CF91|nr:mesoderm posterior protein 1 [Puma yagouaroundi]XP_040349597.1 mesoderm posterior protein 1 [Puma yagouaroundi]XP_040349598.1 mesoderm posterior protein 1 [Puma yagouaroundi]